MSHRGPRKTYPSDGVRWESDTCVTCLWETINAAVLGSPEFLCYKSPQSLIFSYCVTLCYHSKVSLKYKRAFKKISQKGRLFPNTYMCISMSNKLQQANIFTWGFAQVWFSHEASPQPYLHSFCSVFFHLYVMVRGLYGRNPKNPPILFIDSISLSTLPLGPSHSLGLLCSISYPQRPPLASHRFSSLGILCFCILRYAVFQITQFNSIYF